MAQPSSTGLETDDVQMRCNAMNASSLEDCTSLALVDSQRVTRRARRLLNRAARGKARNSSKSEDALCLSLKDYGSTQTAGVTQLRLYACRLRRPWHLASKALATNANQEPTTNEGVL